MFQTDFYSTKIREHFPKTILKNNHQTCFVLRINNYFMLFIY